MEKPTDLYPLKKFMTHDDRAADWLVRRVVFCWPEAGCDPSTLKTYRASAERSPCVIIESEQAAFCVDDDGEFWIAKSGFLASEANDEWPLSASLDWTDGEYVCECPGTSGLRTSQIEDLCGLARAIRDNIHIWLAEKIADGTLQMWGSHGNELAPLQPIPVHAWWQDASRGNQGLDFERAIFATQHEGTRVYSIHLRWTQPLQVHAPAPPSTIKGKTAAIAWLSAAIDGSPDLKAITKPDFINKAIAEFSTSKRSARDAWKETLASKAPHVRATWQRSGRPKVKS